MNSNLDTVKIEVLDGPIEDMKTQAVATVKSPNGTGKLEQLANVKPMESAHLRFEEVLEQRVAEVRRAKAGKADAAARYNANLRYTPEIKWFEHDSFYYRLLEIVSVHDKVMWVKAIRAESTKTVTIEIPQMTKFENILFRGD